MPKNSTTFPIQLKRQWGTEKRTNPLPVVPAKPSNLRIGLSRLAIIATIFFWAQYVFVIIMNELLPALNDSYFVLQAVGCILVFSFLSLSALVYLITRDGAFQRFSKHNRVPRSDIDEFFFSTKPSITVLVPSYAEEPEVIRKTLLSVALQEYPDIRIVLLLDDKPLDESSPDFDKLTATRNLIEDIKDFLAAPSLRFTKSYNLYRKTSNSRKYASKAAVIKAAREYEWAAQWLRNQAASEAVSDHVDVFFINQIYEELATELEIIARALEHASLEKQAVTNDRLEQLYLRLKHTFTAQLDSFERKQYASLSHEPNKAMNLNAYIGLMGASYKLHDVAGRKVLVRHSQPRTADLSIPDSDYILTLDADSILLREYCLRLVYEMEQTENQQVAVIQTPYSAFRGAGTRVERLAGATTDVQHILHQGMTHYGATFWVGANAIIRKKALESIVETEAIGGIEVKRYIQDRTVIEDTESSVDITSHGWRLHNYPERLSYSATPPDFGALIVQRRRWANGGLIIVPKFMSYLRRRHKAKAGTSFTEVLVRMNYLASIAWASFALVFLLVYPFDDRLLSYTMLLAALPYFAAMSSDLKESGYKRLDVFRIYGFNLILLPVNIAGVVKSLQQALSGKKIPFARTPKIKNRTMVPSTYILAPLAIVAYSLFVMIRDSYAGHTGNALFAGFNALTAMWAIGAYIGFKSLLVDLWSGMLNWLYVDVRPAEQLTPSTRAIGQDWRSILHYGDTSRELHATELVRIDSQYEYEGEKI